MADGAYSDEDGLFVSVCGMGAVDDVSVSPAGGFTGDRFKGTAAAAAHVAGIAALMRAKDVTLTTAELRTKLKAACTHPTLAAGQRDNIAVE